MNFLDWIWVNLIVVVVFLHLINLNDTSDQQLGKRFICPVALLKDALNSFRDLQANPNKLSREITVTNFLLFLQDLIDIAFA